MAAAKATYIIVWKKSSQVYSTASLDTAIKTPIPKGCTIDDKRILFASFLPDEETFCVYPLDAEEINKAEQQIKEKKANVEE
jgi:hypothetical protein